MRDAIFHVDRLDPLTLQAQIRETLVSAILSGQLPAGSPVPSTRQLSRQLKVSRNTVSIAYQALAMDGYLESRERSGFFVAREPVEFARAAPSDKAAEPTNTPDWNKWLTMRPAAQPNIVKPADWHGYPYPFLYGQSDPALFPVHEWQDCTRQAAGRRLLDAWTDDSINADDATFVQQIRQRLLPRRGIRAEPDEILVTLGAQNALYLIASLLVRPSTVVGLEDPGYPDARNIFALMRGHLRMLPVDGEGLVTGKALADCDLVYTTPSHQFPTNATMSLSRRQALLDWAGRGNRLIVEDDYEFETNYLGQATPALKSLDRNDRVLYVGSLSKSLVPGLRIGYLVGPRALIREARALRRLILRHPPGNNQRVVALFLALGHHDTLIGRLHRAYRARWEAMDAALEKHLPDWGRSRSFGGTSFWMSGPPGLRSVELARKAAEYGVLLEPGGICFADPTAHENSFRLGFSAISTERIEPGIALLARAAREVAS
ncbi:MocR-like pyridoxine biosynthesis transcription factor PdxR [Pararhizobium haloflavum]|uniref:MocR-like pyridoxine biosynthesis transcription factor PdxR n=1 Tax=Pararhizobium haloflavum TaxID=2037914 RepID=UPI000C181F74|nr:PLP-dependent aminotransferase family protein [Pararhizobium haloflavum]